MLPSPLAHDVASLDLTGVQEELIQAVHATGTPTVVVLINGRALALRVQARLAQPAGLVEEGPCVYGGVCRVFAADENGIYSGGQGCSAS